MPEIPKKQLSKRIADKVRSRRNKLVPELEDIGIYGTNDSAQHILKYAVPTLADTLGARDHSLRALIGRVGSLTRTATVYTSDSDAVSYDVFIERSTEPDNTGKKIGRVTLQIIISHYHKLDESELVAEWPLIEEVGAADALVADAVAQHTKSYDMEDDIDLDDPLLNAELMQGQLDYLSELDAEDEETMVSAMFGCEVERYFEKKLRLTTGFRPSLTINAGYQTDESSYGLKIGDSYSLSLVGDTPSELAVMAQLGTESFVVVDAEAMKEFIEALEVVEILKRTRKRKSNGTYAKLY